MLGPELREATATAPPEPGLEPHGPSEQPTPPNGCPSGLRAQPARAKRALAPVVEFGFTRLMRVYRHPRGGVDRPAYEPHARGFWGKLTPKQKHDAVCAAPYAPGKQWLGYWLDSGRETGKFEIVEQSAAAPRVWVRKDTPQWAAWVADGRCPLTTQHRVDGELETGWMFESEWPPNFNFVQRDGGVA
jgi:hypothetical protein